MTKLTLAVTVAAAVLVAAPAGAQEVTIPRIEAGIVGSGLIVGGEDGALVIAGGGPSVTIGITPRIRVDMRAHIFGPNQGSAAYGLYETVVRFPVGRSSGASPALSMSAGVAGLFSYHRFREFRTTRRDGSVVVYPGQRQMRATAPRIGSVGIAHQRVVSSRASMLLGVDMMIGQGAIIARGTVGLSFGLRRYR